MLRHIKLHLNADTDAFSTPHQTRYPSVRSFIRLSVSASSSTDLTILNSSSLKTLSRYQNLSFCPTASSNSSRSRLFLSSFRIYIHRISVTACVMVLPISVCVCGFFRQETTVHATPMCHASHVCHVCHVSHVISFSTHVYRLSLLIRFYLMLCCCCC